MLEIRNLNFSYRKKEVLKDVSLKVESLDIVLLLGKNGCGKTTLLKLIAKVISSNVYIFNNFNKTLFISDKYELINDLNVYDLLSIFCNYYKVSKEINYYMDYLELENKKVSKLSKGNRQKVVLLLGLLSDADLLVIDEIFDGLDKKTKERIVRLLKQANKTLIIVTHDLRGFSRIKVRKCEIIDGVLYEQNKT